MQKQELIRSVVEMVGMDIMDSTMAYGLIEKITLNEKQSKYKVVLRNEEISNISKRKKKTTKFREWSSEDINFLKENYADLTGREIGEKLNRTKQAISQKVMDLRSKGVTLPNKKSGKGVAWTEREQMFLEQFHNKYSIGEIARKLNRSTSVIHSKIQKLKEVSNEQNDLNGTE